MRVFAGGKARLGVSPGRGRLRVDIALAIVIFGGWDPLWVALGAYFFSTVQVLGIHLQGILPGVPAQVFQTAPFPVMILTLPAVNMGRFTWMRDSAEFHPAVWRLLNYLGMRPPAAPGKDFDPRDTF